MKTLIKGLALDYPVKVIATGLVVLVLLSLPLFWVRFTCETSLFSRMSNEAKGVSIAPSLLVPNELEKDPAKDPNAASSSRASASIRYQRPMSLGIFDYFIARLPGGRCTNVYFFSSFNEWMYFDVKTGQLVHSYLEEQVMPDKTPFRKKVQLYIGPEGVSETADKTLGRFIDPIIDQGWTYVRQRQSRELMIFDKKMRCFFKVDFNQRTTIKGPKIGKNDRRHKPIQIGLLSKTTFELSYLNWSPPQIRPSDRNRSSKPIPIIPSFVSSDAGPYMLVLDESGEIGLLDKESLTIVGVSGWLPAPETYFGSRSTVRPRDLLGYEVMPLFLSTYFFENPEEVRMAFGDMSYYLRREASRVEKKYLGMFATGVSRDGTALALTVFDEKGKGIKSEHTKFQKQEGLHTTPVRSSKAVFFEAPWASTLTIGKYLSENLHPPILSIASYFTASAFEANAGDRALFFLPNSFIAMKARERPGNFAERFFSALWLILPSIILALLLSIRVSKDAVIVGLSENARLYWIIGTIAFGLAAYITYRLTRPKITLVTCQNCGRPRRPDMDRCHRCKSDWHVPELIPPAWRVLNGAEQVDGGLTANEEETAIE